MENTSKLFEVYGILDFNARLQCEFDYLMEKKRCFMDCVYTIKNKNIYAEYDIQNYVQIQKIHKKYIWQCMFNLIYFIDEYEAYDVSLDPSNVFFDINFIPKIMKRDVRYQKKSYLEQLKAFIFYVLEGKQSFQNYVRTLHLYDYKNQFLNEVKSCITVEELYEKILQEIKNRYW